MGFLDGLKKGAAQGLVSQLYKKIEAGDKDAMVKLGTMLLKGDNVQSNPQEAYRLLKMAADLGDQVALNNVGACFEYGAGVEKNLETALSYYKKAATAGYSQAQQNVSRILQILEQDPIRRLLEKAQEGDAEAQAELGARYAKGIDVEQDHPKAIKWLTPAAQACHLDAQFYLGRLYVEEMNMPSEGIPWLERAAENGSSDAQAKLGFYYVTGKYVVKDLEKSIEYLRKAALQGKKEAASNLALAERQLQAQTQETKQSQTTPTTSESAKGGNICTQCGAGLQKDARFCGGCGSKVDQVKFCTGCGAKIVADSKFCGGCGQATEISAAQATEIPAAQATEIPAAQATEIPAAQASHSLDNNETSDLNKENLLEKFDGIDPDLVTLINLKIGYTQGELNATGNADYEDGFKALNHVYWKYTIIKDNGGDTGCDWLLLDWSNPSNTVCLFSDEEISETIGQLIEPTTEEMFGSVIPAIFFQSIVQSVLDEPDGYDFIEEATEKIGGYIEVEEGDKINESFVNSLFAYYEEFDSSHISIDGGKIFVNGNKFDNDRDYEEAITESKFAAFSEDVMGH